MLLAGLTKHFEGERTAILPTLFNTGFQDEEHCPALAQKKGGADICKDSTAPADPFNTCSTASCYLSRLRSQAVVTEYS